MLLFAYLGWFEAGQRWLGAAADRIMQVTPQRWRPANIQSGVVPPPEYAVGLTAGLRLRRDGLMCSSRRQAAGRVHLRTCERCESEVGSVGIHDDIGVVHGLNKELHEEPVGPTVVASHLVQTCNLVVLVHSSHVPATRGKVRVLSSGHGGCSGSGWACCPQDCGQHCLWIQLGASGRFLLCQGCSLSWPCTAGRS